MEAITVSLMHTSNMKDYTDHNWRQIGTLAICRRHTHVLAVRGGSHMVSPLAELDKTTFNYM